MMTIMRYEAGHKQAVRERIVDAASHALRRFGLDGIGIPALMKQVGMTHGGFYAHFKNRDELVADAVRAATEQSARDIFGEEVSLEQTLTRYLSMDHVKNSDGGCVLASLGTDGVREKDKARKAFAEAALGFIRHVQGKLDGAKSPSQQIGDAALVHAATMVGAVVLSRLVRDPQIAERILKAARKSITR
jgi:TetR/AcrR family transcriptional regulator, transcriptional repressor for nem operon